MAGPGLGSKKTQFKKGQSGNPKGRPVGAKVRLANAFLKEVYADFRKHGTDAIIAAREEKPAEYIKIIASLIPKDINVGGQLDNPININVSISSKPDSGE